MRIEHIFVFGFQAAFRGMRNAKCSWDKSDSVFYGNRNINDEIQENWHPFLTHTSKGDFIVVCPEGPCLGESDLYLAKTLIRAGEPHCKFLRYITITLDLTLPRYVWQDVDTYKISTIRNSCSTRFEPRIRPFEKNDFQENDISDSTLKELNDLRDVWVNAKDPVSKRNAVASMKRKLPEGYLQKATYFMNYSTALNMYRQRQKHPLDEFRVDVEGSLCDCIQSLPYMVEFINTW